MTEAPKRSAGVTLTAVVCLAGSAFFLLAGFFTQLALLLHRARPDLTPKLASVQWAGIVQLRVLAAWGILTAAGLLRRRGWARWSTLLFCALLIEAGVRTALPLAFPSGPVATLAPRATNGLVWCYLALAALGASWFWYLHTAGVRTQFGAGRGGPGGRPLSEWLIGWFLILDGALYLSQAVCANPLAIFVVPFGGWAARSLSLGFTAVDWTFGFWLLRRTPLGWTLASARSVFGIADCLLFVLLPGYSSRLHSIRMITAMPSAAPPSMQASVLLEAAIWLIALSFLIARRGAFRSEQIPSQQAL